MSKKKYIHRTNDYTQPYNIVTIDKLQESETNHLTVIRDENDKVWYTGGILVKDEPLVRKVLDTLTNKEQWWLLYYIRMGNPHN